MLVFRTAKRKYTKIFKKRNMTLRSILLVIKVNLNYLELSFNQYIKAIENIRFQINLPSICNQTYGFFSSHGGHLLNTKLSSI